MLKKMIKEIKLAKETVKEVMDMDMIMFPVELVEGIAVFENTGMVRLSGGLVGLAYKDVIDGQLKIALEKGLPSEVREFVLQHELTHIKLGHVSDAYASGENTRLTLLKRVFAKKVDERELQADRYACDVVGREKSINALMWMYELTLNKECLRRIDALLVKEVK